MAKAQVEAETQTNHKPNKFVFKDFGSKAPCGQAQVEAELFLTQGVISLRPMQGNVFVR